MYWLGIILLLIGGLWIVVNAFRTSVLWGLGALLVPFVSVIFAVMNLGDNKIPLVISVAGGILAYMGYGSYVEQIAAMQAAAEASQ